MAWVLRNRARVSCTSVRTQERHVLDQRSGRQHADSPKVTQSSCVDLGQVEHGDGGEQEQPTRCRQHAVVGGDVACDGEARIGDRIDDRAARCRKRLNRVLADGGQHPCAGRLNVGRSSVDGEGDGGDERQRGNRNDERTHHQLSMDSSMFQHVHVLSGFSRTVRDPSDRLARSDLQGTPPPFFPKDGFWWRLLLHSGLCRNKNFEAVS